MGLCKDCRYKKGFFAAWCDHPDDYFENPVTGKRYKKKYACESKNQFQACIDYRSKWGKSIAKLL